MQNNTETIVNKETHAFSIGNLFMDKHNQLWTIIEIDGDNVTLSMERDGKPNLDLPMPSMFLQIGIDNGTYTKF